MSPEALNRGVQAELDRLVGLGHLTPEQRARIGQRYPVGPVDLRALARWFTILGAVGAAAGILVLLCEAAGEWVLRHAWLAIEGGLALAAAGLLVAGVRLRRAGRLPATAAALELLGGAAVQGLLVALAIHLSTGSRNWPALVGLLTLSAAALAYALGNRLLLVVAGVEAFVWFGGSTGYASGWGMWWLGMTYPARFLAAGLCFLGVAWAHARHAPPRWQGFARVFAHLGLLDLHLALWFLALFGWFDAADYSWHGTEAQRLAFSALWAAVSLGCAWAAAGTGLAMLRAYGLTFLLVDLYTFYFQFVAWNTADAWFLHLLVLGGGLVGGGIFLERRLRPPAAPGDAAPAPGAPPPA